MPFLDCNRQLDCVPFFDKLGIGHSAYQDFLALIESPAAFDDAGCSRTVEAHLSGCLR